MTRRNGKEAPRRAAGYVRVSHVGKRAGEFQSPELQRTEIRRWAEYEGVELVDVIEEIDASGREGARRPKFERLVADAVAGRFDTIVVYAISRFSRSLLDARVWLKQLNEHGVSFVSVSERGFDTSTTTGKLMLNLMFSLAEFESDRIGDVWSAVHARRRKQGKLHVSRPVYGYTMEKGTIGEVIPEQAGAVRLAYELRAAGKGFHAIRRELEAAGFVSQSGGRFANSTLGHILRRPAYAGLIRHDGELVEAAHEPIIDLDLWRRVQATHGRDSRTNKRAGTRADALLSGLVVCGRCGYRMTFQAAGGGRLQRPVYRCSSRQSSSTLRCSCAIAQPVIENEVMARHTAILAAVLQGVDFDAYAGAFASTALRRPRAEPTVEPQAEKQRAAIDRTTELMDNLIDRRADGRVSERSFDRQWARLEQRLQEQEARLANIETEPSKMPVPHLPEPDADRERHREGLREWVEEIVVSPAPHRGGTAEQQFNANVGRVAIRWVTPVEEQEQLRQLADEVYYPRFKPRPGVAWHENWPALVKTIAELVPVGGLPEKAEAMLAGR